MIARKAAAAGLSVETFMYRGQIEADRVRRANELVYGGRRTGWSAIGDKAAAHNRTWVVL